jgi:hypothetical protein
VIRVARTHSRYRLGWTASSGAVKFGAPTGRLRVGADLGWRRIHHFEFDRRRALLCKPLLERGIGYEPADFRPGTDGKLASMLPLQLLSDQQQRLARGTIIGDARAPRGEVCVIGGGAEFGRLWIVLPPGAGKAQPSLRIVRGAQQHCFEGLDRGQPTPCVERLFGRMQPHRDPLASVAAAGDLLAIP